VKDTLKPGLTHTNKIKIDRDRTIGFMGDEGRVYSTPNMVEDIEYTCHAFLMDHLHEGENTVGTHVSVDHVGATVEGDTVEITITVVGVDGRAVAMEATVKDSLEEVGRGKHNRVVVDVAKTFERLQAKREKVLGC
jgi:fluoroacetyl-CoA thioesterase